MAAWELDSDQLILRECRISSSQEAILSAVPGFEQEQEHDRQEQGNFDFTPSQVPQNSILAVDGGGNVFMVEADAEPVVPPVIFSSPPDGPAADAETEELQQVDSLEQEQGISGDSSMPSMQGLSPPKSLETGVSADPENASEVPDFPSQIRMQNAPASPSNSSSLDEFLSPKGTANTSSQGQQFHSPNLALGSQPSELQSPNAAQSAALQQRSPSPDENQLGADSGRQQQFGQGADASSAAACRQQPQFSPSPTGSPIACKRQNFVRSPSAREQIPLSPSPLQGAASAGREQLPDGGDALTRNRQEFSPSPLGLQRARGQQEVLSPSPAGVVWPNAGDDGTASSASKQQQPLREPSPNPSGQPSPSPQRSESSSQLAADGSQERSPVVLHPNVNRVRGTRRVVSPSPEPEAAGDGQQAGFPAADSTEKYPSPSNTYRPASVPRNGPCMVVALRDDDPNLEFRQVLSNPHLFSAKDLVTVVSSRLNKSLPARRFSLEEELGTKKQKRKFGSWGQTSCRLDALFGDADTNQPKRRKAPQPRRLVDVLKELAGDAPECHDHGIPEFSAALKRSGYLLRPFTD